MLLHAPDVPLFADGGDDVDHLDCDDDDDEDHEEDDEEDDKEDDEVDEDDEDDEVDEDDEAVDEENDEEDDEEDDKEDDENENGGKNEDGGENENEKDGTGIMFLPGDISGLIKQFHLLLAEFRAGNKSATKTQLVAILDELLRRSYLNQDEYNGVCRELLC